MKKGIIKKITAGVLCVSVLVTSIMWDDILTKAEEVISDELEEIILDEDRMTDEELEDYLKEIEEEGNYQEIEEERTKSSTAFDMGNGVKQVIYYSGDVRYENEDGELVDYDASLVKIEDKEETQNSHSLEGYLYENQSGDMKNYIPEDLTEDTPILMEKDEYAITISPSLSGSKKENSFVGSQKGLSDAKVESEAVEDLYGDVEEKNTSVSYESKDKKYEIEYISTEVGVKENIILKEIPTTNVWKFEIGLEGGLVPVKDKCCEGISFFEEGTDTIVGGIHYPYMNDATGNNYSTAITYDIEAKADEEDKYILTMTVDRGYLEDSNTVYPVTIDPDYTWKDSSNLFDVYVLNGSKYVDTNFYSSSISNFWVGKTGSNGVVRTYLAFKDIALKNPDYAVKDATLKIYENGDGTSKMTIQAYTASAKWDKAKITWNNKPGYKTLLGSSTSAATAKKEHSFNVTSYVAGVHKGGTDNGLLLKASDESTAGKYVTFYGSRNSMTGYRPSLKVTYIEKPSRASSVTLANNVIKPTGKLAVSWKGASSDNLGYIQYRIAKYDKENSKEIDDVVKYSVDTKLKTSADGEDSIDIKSYPEGVYVLVIRAVDKNGYKGTGKGVLFYVDGTAPKITSLSLSPSTTSTKRSSDTPKVTYSISDKYFSKIEYEIDTPEETGTYKQLSTNASGTIELPKSLFNRTTDYAISFRAVDKAGNKTSVTKVFYYKNYLSEIEDFDVKDVVLKDNFDGTTTISWKNKKGMTPSDISYNIYRGDISGIPIEDCELVADNIKEFNYTVTNSKKKKRYYYKVIAVRKNKDNSVTKGRESNEVISVMSSKNELVNRLGINSLYEYQECSTPTGNGYIEKSFGNFVYTETDFELPGNQLPLGISRYYNSQSTVSGLLGNWTIGYEQKIKKVGEEYLYRDCTGAIFRFKKDAKGKLVANGLKEAVLTEEKTTCIIENSNGNNTVVDCYYAVSDENNTKYYFNAEGDLTFIKETNGCYQLLEYSSNGLLNSIFSSEGQKIQFLYNPDLLMLGSARIDVIILPDDSYFLYEYDEDKLVKVSHKSKNSEKCIEYRYFYNSDGEMEAIFDAMQNQYQLKYSNGAITQFVYPNEEKIVLTYDKTNKKTTLKKYTSTGVALYSNSIVYNENGRVVSLTDNNGNEFKYTYESAWGNVSKANSDVYYNAIKNNQIITIKKEKSTTADYKDGKVVLETDASGNTVEYIYSTKVSDAGQPSEVITKSGETIISHILYTYDEKGNVESINDTISGEKDLYTYNGAGDITTQKETFKDVESINATAEYDQYGNEIVSEGASGAVKSNEVATYNELGAIIYSAEKKEDVAKNEIFYHYDNYGRLVETIYKYDGKTEVEAKRYDNNGSVCLAVARDGTVATYEYDMMNRVTFQRIYKSMDEFDNREFLKEYYTRYGYAQNVNIHLSDKHTKKYNILTTEVVYNQNGYLVSEKYFDALGNVVREKASGIYTDYSYDKQGRIVTTYTLGTGCEDTSLGKLTYTLYDENGNVSGTVINPKYENGAYYVQSENSITSSSKYDAMGNIIEQTDGNGNVVKYEYNNQKQLVKVILNDGNSSFDGKTISYDVKMDASKSDIPSDKLNDKVLFADTAINVLGSALKTIKNASGETLETIDGVGDNTIKTLFEYNEDGKVSKITYSDGSYTENAYDEKYRLSKVTHYNIKNKTACGTIYNYDINDNVIKSVDFKVENGKQKPYRYAYFEYDCLQRLTGYYEENSSSEPSKETIRENRLVYEYDEEDKLVKIIYPNKFKPIKSIEYTYNADRWLSVITVTVLVDGKEVRNLVREYQYAKDGKVSAIKDYNNPLTGSSACTEKRYTYDVFDRVTKMEYVLSTSPNVVKESYEYTYDKNDNILTEKIYNGYVSGEGTVNKYLVHKYDAFDRLISTSTTDYRSNKTSNTKYTYDKMGNRLTEDRDGVVTTYTYDSLCKLISSVTKKADGNITSKKAYSYSLVGELTKVEDSVTKEVSTYSYDVCGQLLEYSHTKNNILDAKQSNEYNGDGQRIKKIENGQITNYYYQNGVVLYTTDKDNNLTSFNLIGDTENYTGTIRYSSGKLEYYEYNKDIKGSISTVTNESGAGVVSYEYSDFGETQKHGSQDFVNEICFAQAIYDSMTSLYYMNARYYDPSTGRFISMDTYRGSDTDYSTWNLYTYCANNPVKYIDPSGHVFKSLKKLAKVAVKVTKKAVKTVAKKTVQVAKKAWSNKNVRKVVIGTAIIGVCAAATILTGGGCASIAGAIAYGAFKGAVVGAATGAAMGGATNAIGYAIKNKTLKGSSQTILDGMADGYLSGAISGAITGAMSGAIKGPQCFVEGTPILTESENVNIEDIKVGDRVYAKDVATGTIALKKVTRLFRSETDVLVHLQVAEEEITTTEGHPFYVKDKGWVTAGELEAGDIVFSEDGQEYTVESKVLERVKEKVTVYNFEVEDYHTYFVGEHGILVHNKCAKSKGGKTSVPDKAKQIANGVKNNNGTPPKGYKGGRTYKNIPLEDGAQKLPGGVNYREYDINPYIKGQNRGAERIVIGDDGSVWYTNDHYFTFNQLE